MNPPHSFSHDLDGYESFERLGGIFVGGNGSLTFTNNSTFTDRRSIPNVKPGIFIADKHVHLAMCSHEDCNYRMPTLDIFHIDFLYNHFSQGNGRPVHWEEGRGGEGFHGFLVGGDYTGGWYNTGHLSEFNQGFYDSLTQLGISAAIRPHMVAMCMYYSDGGPMVRKTTNSVSQGEQKQKVGLRCEMRPLHNNH